MTRFRRRVRAAVFLRSLAVQGSWNYRTLIGCGFAFALVPALRALYRDRPDHLRDAVGRHSGLFNSHPYLASMALGAVAELEARGEDPALIERFKAAVRGSLGTLGDRLMWAGWRPVCILFALALFVGGATWWAMVVAFLVVYNSGHLLVRAWAYHVGLHEGKAVGERLRRLPIARAQRLLNGAGAFLVGLVLPQAATGALAGVELSPPWIAAGAAGAAVGAGLGARVRSPVVFSLAAVTLIGLLLRVIR